VKQYRDRYIVRDIVYYDLAEVERLVEAGAVALFLSAEDQREADEIAAARARQAAQEAAKLRDVAMGMAHEHSPQGQREAAMRDAMRGSRVTPAAQNFSIEELDDWSKNNDPLMGKWAD
jgi:hypothetical protein